MMFPPPHRNKDEDFDSATSESEEKEEPAPQKMKKLKNQKKKKKCQRPAHTTSALDVGFTAVRPLSMTYDGICWCMLKRASFILKT